ncbi:MAG: heavy metal translocating P-type ATPase [Clostridia bacterium]|nr:heavy metal translocating P-type ATPase [Clostridia bacterium]
MQHYSITGMSCDACRAHVEKAVKSVAGVEVCSVNLLTNSMGVEGTASPEEIIKAVQGAGYGASLKDENLRARYENEFKDTETPKIRKRFIVSLVILLALMYITMGHNMAGFPLPGFLAASPLLNGITQMILSGAILIINRRFFINGAKGFKNLAPNMDSLVSLGSGVSYVWSIYIIILMITEHSAGDMQALHAHLHGLYFESAAMILVLITLGKMLEAKSKGKTTSALRGLMELTPDTAVVIRDGKEEVIPAGDLVPGDIFAVKAGEKIPVDGVVIKGNAAVDESALTGESIPAEKEEGSAVNAATVSKSGYMLCRAEKVGEDTALSRIIRLVSDATATKAPIARIADRVSAVFVPVVTGIALITFIAWLLSGRDVAYALQRAVSVLVISCPCSLGLATPVAVMAGSGAGAKHGILFKTSASLEEAGKIEIIALDKTGTITSGNPEITDIIPAPGFDRSEFINCAASLESKSEHPLAKAVAAVEGAQISDVQNIETFTGSGITGSLGGVTLSAGNAKFMSAKAEIPTDYLEKADELASHGKTPLFFSRGSEFAGIIALADSIKPESVQGIKELKNLGVKTVMLTGDNEKTAKSVASLTGVDSAASALMPDGKAKAVAYLRSLGKTAMAGDGINDAPALVSADTGIAIGAGTDVAIDAADIVLMKSRLTDVSAAVRLSRKVLRIIKQNLFWALFYNCLGIPLAAGVFIPAFGLEINPMFGAAAMSLSSIFVVTNALRLNLFDPADTSHDRAINSGTGDLTVPPEVYNTNDKETAEMKKTIYITGMMCPHCENAVKTALECLEGVESADVSHESGKAVVTLKADIEDSILKKAVEDKGYTVTVIE